MAAGRGGSAAALKTTTRSKRGAYLFIENADALYAEYASRGVEFTRALGDTPWNSRGFVVKDCDGRLLAFAADSD